MDGSSGRSYKCQRCLNHNRVVCRKGHRCPYKDCVCPGCDLNNLRSKLMTALRERGLNHADVFLNKKAGRKQHCMLCSFHGQKVELRGHKRNCARADCQCSLCVVGRHYRDTMAKQTKHRRSQRKSTPTAARNISSCHTSSESRRSVAVQEENHPTLDMPTSIGGRFKCKDSEPCNIRQSPGTMALDQITSKSSVDQHMMLSIQFAQALGTNVLPSGPRHPSLPSLNSPYQVPIQSFIDNRGAIDLATAIFLSNWPLTTYCQQAPLIAASRYLHPMWKTDITLLPEYSHIRSFFPMLIG